MGQNTSKNQAKLHNKDKFKHLNKLAQGDALTNDAERIQQHNMLQNRILSPKMGKLMASAKAAESSTPSPNSKLLDRRK